MADRDQLVIKSTETPIETTIGGMVASNWRPIAKGALMGAFSLEMPSGLILHECCLFRKDDREWVSGPTKQIKSGDKVRYEALVEFATREDAAQFTADAIAALDRLEPAQ
jgi:hypothetical protein